jgi:hypothetical protein
MLDAAGACFPDLAVTHGSFPIAASLQSFSGPPSLRSTADFTGAMD